MNFWAKSSGKIHAGAFCGHVEDGGIWSEDSTYRGLTMQGISLSSFSSGDFFGTNPVPPAPGVDAPRKPVQAAVLTS